MAKSLSVTSVDDATTKAVEKCLAQHDSTLSIRPKQLEALFHLLRGKDVLCLLPTASGKSMIYQLLPSVFMELGRCESPIVIVLSPLIALMVDQVNEANSKQGLKLTSVRLEGGASYNDIASGKFNLIFGSPESWLNNKKWRDMLSMKLFLKNLICIVVDEVHKVTWGAVSSNNSKPFREVFSRIGELRSLCRESTPVLALTATADADISDLIVSSCGLSKSTILVSSIANRPNIRLSVVKTSKSISCLKWLLIMLKELGRGFPKTIIYCKSIKLTGWLYEKIISNLGNHAFAGQIKQHSNLLVGMYHSETLQRHKAKLMKALIENEGSCRLFIATSTLGCGINPQNVKYVIHFGPSHGLADYCQQIGRAGRDSSMQCHAILYVYPQGGASIISKDMKSFIDDSDKTCLRTSLFSRFNADGENVPSLDPSHLCCSFCSKSCTCSTPDCLSLCEFEINIDCAVEKPPLKVRDVDPEQKNSIKSSLERMRYVAPGDRSQFLFVPNICMTGLTDEVIQSFLENLVYIKSINDILKYTHIINTKIAMKLLSIINDTFNDIDEEELDVQPDDEQFDFELLGIGDEDMNSSDEEHIREDEL